MSGGLVTGAEGVGNDVMRKSKGGDPRLSWPPDFDEIFKRMHQQEMRSWREPKSGDLLRDVGYLQGRIAKEKNRTVRGIYARGAIVMGVATIEAVTNDALASIYELLTDTIPSECAGEPPWCYFIGRSTRRIATLLRKGQFAKKRAYVLDHIERLTWDVLEDRLIKDIDRLVLFRNRIVHMSYYERPNLYRSLLNTGQVAHMAEMAKGCAHEYVDFLSYEFSELNLPIRTIRPFWHLEDDLEDS